MTTDDVSSDLLIPRPAAPGDMAVHPGRSDVRWGLLGPVTATRDEDVLDLGPPRQRAVLTVLLARAGETVSLARVVEAVWGDEPPSYAANVVHRHVGALRRIVQPGLPRRAQGDWLLSGSRGFRVAVGEDTLDLLRFRALAARAAQRADDGERLDGYEAALALWRGPVAEDVAGRFATDPGLHAIEREYADAAVAAGESALAVGQVGRVLPALTLAARMHPADETVHALLIRALASTGRRAAALETFEVLRTMLDDELGVPPGPLLADAHLAVLQDTIEVSSRRPVTLPVPRQLPADHVGFVGREDEVRTVVDRLRAATGAVCVVTGTAGVGKTTLAVHAAHLLAGDFRDGQLHVDLRGFDATPPAAPYDVLGRFLLALHVPADRIPDDLDDRAALYRSVLGERRVLVVLDNAGDSGQVLPLLPGAGPSGAIVTSRRQLRGLAAAGHHVVPLGLFDHEQSERFLRSRLSARAVEGEPAAADAVIELSGGLPLSLSLLAARASHSASVSLADIAGAVRESRTALATFTDSADARTSTRSILSWSYAALTPETARLFTALAVHPAASVAVDEAAALAGLSLRETRVLLDELVEANIATEQAGDRIWRHDLLRQYAAELLAEAEPAVRERAEQGLYEHLTPRAVEAARVLNPLRVLPGSDRVADAWAPASEAEATAWFDERHKTLAALVVGARAERFDAYIWRLAWALDHYLDRRGAWQELLAVQLAGLAAAERSGEAIERVVMRRGVARAYANLGRYTVAADEVRSALATLTAQPEPDLGLVSETYRQLSWILSRQDDLPGALDAARQGLALHPGDSREPVRAFALNAVGYYEARLGAYDEALEHCNEAMRLLEGSEHRYGLADTWDSLGLIRSRLGDLERAAEAYERAHELFGALGVRFAEADTALELGRVYAALQRPAYARRHLETAQRVFGELGHEQAGSAAEALADLDRAGQ